MDLVKMQITEHFALSEFACGSELAITPTFVIFVVNVLEPFRIWYNRPINVNSGYRTEAKNKAVGGVLGSLHLDGRAVDFNYSKEYFEGSAERKKKYVNNMVKEWNKWCVKAGGYGQVVIHPTYIHMGLSFKHVYCEDLRGI